MLTTHQKALNLFNAALVTPTYYVFFTSATIVTSAVLFQGFKGTPATIATVIMGFLQICAGVILLQLSKSAKDVPDAAVFKGDLDQVRTVAEQEEPEYEPRADTIRGGGALLRSISKYRTKKQIEEVKRLHDETMEPIHENEVVEWDGLRRRKTVLEPGAGPVPQRTKTLHPPLGMSHFPDDDESDRQSVETDMHPGILPWRRRSRGMSNTTTNERMQMSPIKGGGSISNQPHTFGLPLGLSRRQTDGNDDQDTAYHGASQHIHFADEDAGERSKSANSSRTLVPPPPPPHSAKRQFSFQNILNRNRTSSGDSTSRPTTSSSRLSYGRKNSANSNVAKTEEERLGLVKGDSRNILGGEINRSPSPPEYSDGDGNWDGYDGRQQSTSQGPLAREGLGYVREEEEDADSGGSRPRHQAPLPPLPQLRSDATGGGYRRDRPNSDDLDDDTPTPTRAFGKSKF